MEKQTTLTPKTCKCGLCDQDGINIPIIKDFDGVSDVYDICNITCPKCQAKCTGGNYITGETDSWMSEKEISEANAWFQQQIFEAETKEMWLAEEEY